ncbi:MAG: nucleoside-diphosphate kinase [Anaerolineales bacterium]|nr:nucleoside-diphosphate kinase [Anaerolineales bacterium]
MMKPVKFLYYLWRKSVERSLVLVKPDGVQRALVGEVVSRLERRGLRLVGAKFMQVSRELAETHYAIHKGKPFYDGLIEYITSAPVMAMVWEGPNAVAAIRQTMGSTRPTDAAPGSLRHDFALEVGRNLTHASDSVENGAAEVELWFGKEELVEWKREVDRWVFEGR